MRQRGSRTISDVDGTRALPSVAEFEVSVAAYPGVPGGLSGGEECSRRPPQPEARDRCGRLVQHGVPLNTVRDLLGHSSVGMSLRYEAPDQRREAVAKFNEKPLLALTVGRLSGSEPLPYWLNGGKGGTRTLDPGIMRINDLRPQYRVKTEIKQGGSGYRLVKLKPRPRPDDSLVKFAETGVD